MYGKTKYGLARDLRITEDEAADCLRQCARTYPDFYRWRPSIVNGALRADQTYFTPLGWPFWTGLLRRRKAKDKAGRDYKTMLSFPMQSAGCDWMTAALIAATESGIEVCASVHDGFLITADAGRLDETVARMATIMRDTSVVLFDEPMFIDCGKPVHWPDRFAGRMATGRH